MKRRTFFKFGLTSAAMALLKSNRLHANADINKKNDPDLIQRRPVVVSTWNHGIQANEEAWGILLSLIHI